MALMAVLWLSLAGLLSAQQPDVHYYHQGAMPPGAIGSQQLQRGGPLPGYFQPVELKGPPGSMIAMVEGGTFGQPQASPVRVGLLIGQVYRLRVTNIPLREGQEVFPTVEIVDRLYTPRGQESRFPILMELTLEDLQFALDGKFVTRVIYLEDPELALPVAQVDKEQGYFEARPGEDPLALADQLGRPVAILRLGGRQPDMNQGFDMAFLFGSPPLVKFPPQVKLLGPPRESAPAAPKTPPGQEGANPNRQTAIPTRTVW